MAETAVQRRGRSFVFTVNNYTDADFQRLATLDCKYLIVGREIAPTTGTPHLQGYVHFSNPRSFNAVRGLLPAGTHVEVARGSPQDNIVYCSKSGDFVEHGERPTDGGDKGAIAEKRRWQTAFESAKKGDLDAIPGDIMLRCYNTIKKIHEDFFECPKSLDKLENEWRYGNTGTGKSRTTREDFPDAYPKAADTRWWDGYRGQPDVVIDDFDKYNKAQGQHLKIWLDHYPFNAERKGGNMMIRPRRIIITSNYHPREIWDDPQTINPVLRRVSVLHYKDDGTIEEEATGFEPVAAPFTAISMPVTPLPVGTGAGYDVSEVVPERTSVTSMGMRFPELDIDPYERPTQPLTRQVAAPSPVHLSQLGSYFDADEEYILASREHTYRE